MEQKERILKAEEFYDAKLKSKLEPLFVGQYVAIDPQSGVYFLGSSVTEASLRDQKMFPGRKLVCLRVGYPATRFAGSHA